MRARAVVPPGARQAPALGLVLLFAIAGEAILRYLNVSISSLSIAGGLLLLLLAVEMFRGIDEPGEDRPRETDVALVLLASPLVAGPGAIATAMVLARRYSSAGGRVGVLLGIVCAAVVVGIALLVANRGVRRLPPSLTHFVTRVLGLLLAAIGVQLIRNGILGSFG
jgi:multiple antibiotic resistance protein